jgi:hypothetical protein
MKLDIGSIELDRETIDREWVNWNKSDKLLRFGQHVWNCSKTTGSWPELFYEQDPYVAYNLLISVAPADRVPEKEIPSMIGDILGQAIDRVETLIDAGAGKAEAVAVVSNLLLASAWFLSSARVVADGLRDPEPGLFVSVAKSISEKKLSEELEKGLVAFLKEL